MNERADGTIEFQITEQTPVTSTLDELWQPERHRRAQRRWWLMLAVVVLGGGVIGAAAWHARRQAVDSAPTLAPHGCLVDVTDELTLGDEGDDVFCLESSLVRLDFMADADDVFDQDTDAAVRAFQEFAGRTVDGKVGPKTRAAILNSERAFLPSQPA